MGSHKRSGLDRLPCSWLFDTRTCDALSLLAAATICVVVRIAQTACVMETWPYERRLAVMGQIVDNQLKVQCRFCRQLIVASVFNCSHCGRDVATVRKSDATAGWLGLALGPVGLWYKGYWLAGFGWLAVVVVLGIVTGAWLAIPICWVGMAIHAAAAKPRR